VRLSGARSWKQLCSVLQELFESELGAATPPLSVTNLEMQFLNEEGVPVLANRSATPLERVLASTAVLLSDKPVAALVASGVRAQEMDASRSSSPASIDSSPGRLCRSASRASTPGTPKQLRYLLRMLTFKDEPLKHECAAADESV